MKHKKNLILNSKKALREVIIIITFSFINNYGFNQATKVTRAQAKPTTNIQTIA